MKNHVSLVLGLHDDALESFFTSLGVLYHISESKSHILVHSDTATVRLHLTAIVRI